MVSAGADVVIGDRVGRDLGPGRRESPLVLDLVAVQCTPSVNDFQYYERVLVMKPECLYINSTECQGLHFENVAPYGRSCSHF